MSEKMVHRSKAHRMNAGWSSRKSARREGKYEACSQGVNSSYDCHDGISPPRLNVTRRPALGFRRDAE